MSEDIKRRFHEFINHDPTIKGHKIVHEVAQLLRELTHENAELKARLWGKEPKEELVKCSACATISNWNKLTCGCPKCGNNSFYDVDKPKPQGEE